MESLWRVETHAHTAPVSPCGRLAPEQLVEQVRAAGYDALFVTDHYTPEFFAVHPTGEDYHIYLERYFSGYRRAAEAGRRVGLRVFPGLEVRLYDGPEDYLVYGVSPEQLAELPCLAFLSLEELHAAVRSTPDGVLVPGAPLPRLPHLPGCPPPGRHRGAQRQPPPRQPQRPGPRLCAGARPPHDGGVRRPPGGRRGRRFHGLPSVFEWPGVRPAAAAGPRSLAQRGLIPAFPA